MAVQLGRLRESAASGAMLRKLPDAWLRKLSPAMGAYSQLQSNVKRQVAEIQHAHQTRAYDKTGEVVVAVGTITTARALGVSTYFTLVSPAILSRLKAELEAAIPDPAQPLGHAISHRLHRICPDKTLVYPYHDERIFADSYAFRLERWVGNPRLDSYLVSFGKGGRACLGINLAYAELYLARGFVPGVRDCRATR
ncbi:hypothetical protein PG988_011998 [Apiospora saccharicola]